MYPIAFTIFGKEIHFYGVCIALGFLAATWLMVWKRKRAKMTTDQVFDLAMIALFTGILGARILHVIQNWDSQSGFLWVFRIDQGGLVFYGGFILAIICVGLYAKRKKLNIMAILDLTAPAIAIAHAFGRLGCFLQGCCFGSPARHDAWYTVRFPLAPEPGRFPLELYLPDGLTTCPVYATQLWESAANVLICAGLLYLYDRWRKPGQIAGVYIITYACVRFLLEFFRGDNPDIFLGLTTSQTIALFLMIPAGAALLVLAKNKPEIDYAAK